jgi:hypothetical protein
MNRSVLVLSLLLVSACETQENIEFSGTTMDDLFPFDGFRTWEFINTDNEIGYKLVGQMDNVVEVDDDTSVNVYRVDYSKKDCTAVDPDCLDGELLWSLKWSSSGTYGVRIHGMNEGRDEATWVDFDEPLQVATATMKVGETVTSTINGQTWTSTLQAFEDCPVYLPVEWKDCAHLEVVDTGGDALSGMPIAGDYWAIAGRNVVAISRRSDTGQWQLADDECEGECNGLW